MQTCYSGHARFSHLFFVLALLAIPGVLIAQETATGTIAGRVAARDGSVLSRATIALDSGRQGTFSAGNGTFKLSGVTAGAHSINVSYVGYSPFTTTVSVQAGATVQLEIVLDDRPSGSTVVVNAPRIPYRPQLSSTALKTTTPLIETPASVQIVTAERLTEQRADRVSDMFDYMTGVVQAGGQRAQDYLMRGISVDNRFIPYQIDGISGGVWRQHEPPAAIIERIEYLKGPSSTLYGITQLGGLINYITKKPKAEKEAMIELRHSTYASDVSPFGAKNSANVTADMTGPLDDDRRFLYRVIANHINTTSYRNDVVESSLDLLPEITWNIDEGTQLTASMNVNVDKGRWDEFLPVPGRDISKIPDIRTRINEPTDYYWDYGWGLGYIARHVIDKDWVISSVGRHTERWDGRELFEFTGVKKDLETMGRQWRDQANERFYTYFDVTTEGHVQTGSIAHTLLIGMTVGNELIHFDRRNIKSDSTLNIDIYEPVHDAHVLLPPKPGYDRHWNNLFLGGYVQDQIALVKQLQLVAGVQYIDASTHHEEQRAGLVFDKNDNGFSPRVGLVVLPVPNLSVYGSYSTSFSPTSAEYENAEGNLDFKPQTGQEVEAGVKFDLLESRIGGTVAVYQLDYKNALNATGERNPNGNTAYVQTGHSRSKGVELDLFVSPVTGLYLTTGYAYTDARVIEDNDPKKIGQRLTYVPYNSANIWATYQLPVESLSGMKIGLGATSLGSRPTEFPTSTGLVFSLPAYTRFDGLISYDFSGATVGVNVNNIFDRRYFASGGVSRIIPGSPRTVRTSLQVRM